MSKAPEGASREGGLEEPVRHPVDWRHPDYHNPESLRAEQERVFDICHGCRRCVSLCEAFPTLFDLIDESPSFELDSVDPADYEKVSDQCYLCDLCFQTKCPYVPPHPFNLDFPHLMLRARSKKFADKGGKGIAGRRDKVLAATDGTNRLLTIPLVDVTVNALNRFRPARAALQAVAAIHRDAPLPKYHSSTARKRLKDRLLPPDAKSTGQAQPAGPTRGRVAVYASCYCNSCEPGTVEDLVAVLEHNGVETRLLRDERCCGMPQLELGDLPAVDRARAANIPQLAEVVRAGWDLVSPIPSCVLMFKQEFPLLFADDDEVKLVGQHVFDPFEYLAHRHGEKLLKTDFAEGFAAGGKVFYQVACHQRVQKVGLKTRDLLSLIPGCEIEMLERCSGHDGSYAVRAETRAHSVKIARPVVRAIDKAKPDWLTSDCPLALRQLDDLSETAARAAHPISILRNAYGI